MAVTQAMNPPNQQSFLLLENAVLLKQEKKPEGHRLSSGRVLGSGET